MHDLAAFVFHFHFFLGVAIGQEGIDMGQDIERDLVRIDLAGDGLAVHDLLHLAAQFFDGLGAGARDRLVTRGEDPLDVETPGATGKAP